MPMNRYIQIAKFLKKQGEPRFRYSQIFDFVFDKHIIDIGKMTNIPKRLRLQLKEKFPVMLSIKELKKISTQETTKYLFEFEDQNRVEVVNMMAESKRHWNSLCISTQVGCSIGCKFCATGKMGFIRNLSTDEITDQVLFFRLNAIPVDNILFMGMGEPLLNPNLIESLKILTSSELFNIGARKISISTIGIPKKLEEVTKEFPQINYALSLHSPFEKERNKLIPYSKNTSISQLFDILDCYIQTSKRKVFVSYVLLRKLNDTPKHAEALAKLIKSRGKNSYLYHVNLIPYNTTGPEDQYAASSTQQTAFFQNLLRKFNVNCTVRYSKGRFSEAACGQLHAGYISSIKQPTFVTESSQAILNM